MVTNVSTPRNLKVFKGGHGCVNTLCPKYSRSVCVCVCGGGGEGEGGKGGGLSVRDPVSRVSKSSFFQPPGIGHYQITFRKP